MRYANTGAADSSPAAAVETDGGGRMPYAFTYLPAYFLAPRAR